MYRNWADIWADIWGDIWALEGDATAVASVRKEHGLRVGSASREERSHSGSRGLRVPREDRSQ